MTSALLSIFFVPGISFLAVVLIRDSHLNAPIPSLIANWQELAFWLVFTIGSLVSALFGFKWQSGNNELKSQRAFVWAALSVLFLYIACSALCAKVGYGACYETWWQDLGLFIFCLGGSLRLWSIFTLGRLHSALVSVQENHKVITSGPYRLIRHPSYLSILICLAGIAMIFRAWLPLLSLPGIFIALKWRILNEEKFLLDNLSPAASLEYAQYQKRTWYMFPKLY